MKSETLEIIKKMQKGEITEHVLYSKLAQRTSGHNRQVLARISREEQSHAAIWEKITGETIEPDMGKVYFYYVLSWIFGLTFVINLMETGEANAQGIYQSIAEEVPSALEIFKQEQEHEASLIAMVDEERLRYIGSMVLGLNDALVELTGSLAGFTLALGNSRTIGMAGFITGSAATLSMAASEYLSKKADPNEPHPLKACIYTGIAYVITVGLLLLPYFLFSTPLISLLFCLIDAGLVILVFTFFVSVVRKEPFKPAFVEMISISFSVAVISFLIGWAAKVWLGIDA